MIIFDLERMEMEEDDNSKNKEDEALGDTGSEVLWWTNLNERMLVTDSRTNTSGSLGSGGNGNNSGQSTRTNSSK